MCKIIKSPDVEKSEVNIETHFRNVA